MRVCIQRVRQARVTVEKKVVGEIGLGLLVLLGVAADDGDSDADYLADKIAGLRILDDGEGKMNLSVRDVQGSILVVSQFTLYADCRKGKRPSFVSAAPPALAEMLYERFVNRLQQLQVPVACGQFRAHMQVELVNDGPVTILLESRPAP